MPKDLRSLNAEELRAYYANEDQNAEDSKSTFKDKVNSVWGFVKSTWAAGVNWAGTTYDWMVDNNPDGVGYTFDYNTALQLQDRKRQLEQIDTSTLDQKGLTEYINQKNAITSNFKALLTDPSVYDEKQMDKFLNNYRESRGYSLLKDAAESQNDQKATRQVVLEKLAMEEMRDNIYKNIKFIDHTITKSDGTQIQYSAHDLPIIMDTVIKNHQRNFEGAVKALAFYQNLEDNNQNLSDADKKVKQEAQDHIDNISRYMADYINNLETSTSVGSADFAAEWMKKTNSDNPFTVKNGLGLESNNELYFERQLNKRRIGKFPLNPIEYIEHLSNLMYEVGDNAMTVSKILVTTPFKGFDEAKKDAMTLHDSQQVTNTENTLLKENTFLNTMSNWLLDAGPDIALFIGANRGVGKLTELASGALSVERLSQGFNIASKIIRTSKKLHLDKIDEALTAMESATPAAKALSAITSFVVRETIENFGAQMSASGGTMEDYNEVDLALDLVFSALFGGIATASQVISRKVLLEANKSLLRAQAGKLIFGISDELRSQIDDQTKQAIGDATLTFIKHDNVNPHLQDLAAKARATYNDVEDFVTKVKTVAEVRFQEVLKHTSTLKKYAHLISKGPDGLLTIAKDAPEGTYMKLNEEYVEKITLEAQANKSGFAAGVAAFYLNKEKSLIERFKKFREAWNNFSEKQKEEILETRKFVVEKNPVMKAMFDKWILDTGRKYPETNEEWVNRLEEFSFESARIKAEFDAKGKELQNQVLKDHSDGLERKLTNPELVPEKGIIGDSRVAGFLTRRKRAKNKHTILRAIQQGYDFAVKFVPALEKNGKEYFEAVMGSDIGMAAKIAALHPIDTPINRSKNVVSAHAEDGNIFIKSPMFSNPVEVAYFLGKSGLVDVNGKKYKYNVDYLSGKIVFSDNKTTWDLFGKNAIPTSLDGKVEITFIKKKESQIEDTLTTNNSTLSILSSRYSYESAKQINDKIASITKKQYNKILNQNISPLEKANILDEMLTSPPKFDEKGTYMQNGDYGFKYFSTMQMFWGRGGTISTRGFNLDNTWGKERTLEYSLDRKSKKYILTDPETDEVVGWADEKEVFINDKSFQGDILLSSNASKLSDFNNSIKIIKGILEDPTKATTEEAVKAFKKFTGVEPPRTKKEIQETIINTFHSKYPDDFPIETSYETMLSLIHLAPDEFDNVKKFVKSYDLNAKATEKLVDTLTKDKEKLLDFAAHNKEVFTDSNDLIYYYLESQAEKGKSTLVRKTEPVSDLKQIYDYYLPKEIFNKLEVLKNRKQKKKFLIKLQENNNNIFAPDVVDFLKQFLGKYKQQYEDFITSIKHEAERVSIDFAKAPKYSYIEIDGEYFNIDDAVKEYNSIISNLTKFYNTYFPKVDQQKLPIKHSDADEIAKSISGTKSESVFDQIDDMLALPSPSQKAPPQPPALKPSSQPEPTQEQIKEAVKITKTQPQEEEIPEIKASDLPKNVPRDVKYDAYKKLQNKRLQERETPVSDYNVFKEDMTYDAARQNNNKASWFRNKEVFNPEKHMEFLENDIVIKQSTSVSTVGEVIDRIASFANESGLRILHPDGLEQIKKIYGQDLNLGLNVFSDKNAYKSAHAGSLLKNETWMGLQRSSLDLIRMSVLAVLNGADSSKLWLPEGVDSYNKALKFYMDMWGAPRKGEFSMTRTTSPFGTYYYGQISEYLFGKMKAKRNNITGTSIHKIGDGVNPRENIPLLHRMAKVIARLYNTLPYNSKVEFRKTSSDGRKTLKSVNDQIFNKNIGDLTLHKKGGKRFVNGIEVSEREFDAINLQTSVARNTFNLVDSDTSLRMAQLASDSSVLGVLNKNIDKVKTAKSYQDFKEQFNKYEILKEDFIFINSSSDEVAKDIKAMNETGRDLVTLKGYDAHVLSPFGFLYKPRINIKDAIPEAQAEDIARNMNDIKIDHDIGTTKTSAIPKTPQDLTSFDLNIENQVEAADINLYNPQNAVKDKTKRFKSPENHNPNPGDTATQYRRDWRQNEKKRLLNMFFNEKGALNQKAVIEFIQKYGPIKIDPESSFPISVTSKVVPWFSEASEAIQKKMFFDAGVQDTLLIGEGWKSKTMGMVYLPEGVRGNYISSTSSQSLLNNAFEMYFVKVYDEAKNNSDIIKKLREDATKVFVDSGQQIEKKDGLVSIGQLIFEKIAKFDLEKQKIDPKEIFFPSFDKAKNLEAAKDFKDITSKASFAIDPNTLNDEVLREIPSGNPNALIIVGHTDNFDKWLQSYAELSARGYEPILMDNIVGEYMNMNGTYWIIKQENKVKTLEDLKKRIEAIRSDSNNALPQCR